MSQRQRRSGAVNVENLKKIIEAIADYAPRNADGELAPPYRKWATQIERDIAKYQKWAGGAS